MDVGYRIIHTIFKWPVRLLFRVHVHGAKNEPKKKDGPYLMCVNHYSNLDPMLLASAVRHQLPHYMGKEELFRIKPLSWFFRWMGAFPIRRGGADVKALRRAVELMQEKRKVVCVFPQGRRCPGVHPKDTPVYGGIGMLAEWTRMPVLPVLIWVKGFRYRPFCRVDIYIGKPIPFEELPDPGAGKGRYEQMSGYIFSKMLAMAPEEGTDER
ncbi:MAG: 1-acyl-sn-glycerol-3-phosphate acyltransferase [Clostridia bacterium]|nr:1-acyl-sn-glycerol-3-phosphate acyltransferase [Clostridia bacterium]